MLIRQLQIEFKNILTDEEIEYIKNNNIVIETDVMRETIKQINEYLNKERKKFDICKIIDTTEFNKNVLGEVENIPYGETRTYKDIAISIGNEKASRAVGNANNKNKFPLIIPCHRVIGSSGKLVGYRGGLETKKYLLELEKNNR